MPELSMMSIFWDAIKNRFHMHEICPNI